MKKKLLNILSTLLIVALAVMALVVIVSKINNKVIFVFGGAVIWVSTGSMDADGGIPEQSYILVQRVKDASTEVEVGDVITFYSDDPQIKGLLNTHRVVQIDAENGCFITKGDANAGPDEYPVPYENVVAEYVCNLPFLTSIGRVVMSTWGFAALMVLMLAMICATYIPDIVRGLSQKENTAQAELSQTDDAYNEEIRRRIAEEVERLKQSNGEDVVLPNQGDVPAEIVSQPTQNADGVSQNDVQTKNGENDDV